MPSLLSFLLLDHALPNLLQFAQLFGSHNRYIAVANAETSILAPLVDLQPHLDAPHRVPRPGGPTRLLSLVCRRGHSRKMFSPFPAASECNRGKPQRVVHIPDALRNRL